MVNKVILIGNLGADPEIRYTQNGAAVSNFRMATTEKFKQDDEWQERTEWHRVCAFGRLAEIMAEYLVKGSRVYIEGKIQTRKWEDRDGNTRYTTEIIAREMKMLSRVESGNQGPPPEEEHRAHQDQGLEEDVPF